MEIASTLDELENALPDVLECCEACGKIEDADLGVKNPDDGAYLCGDCVDAIKEDDIDRG